MKRDDFKDASPGRLVPLLSHPGLLGFAPNPLIGKGLSLPPSTLKLVEKAAGYVGRLSAAGEHIENPYLLIQPLIVREAIASSAIEGTIATPRQLLLFEIGALQEDESKADASEVSDYVRALKHGLSTIGRGRPLSLNAIKDLHAILLGGPRNANSLPGKFRREQNCIRGERSIDIEDARFVPPPVDEMNRGLDDFEKAMHRDHDYPDLVWLALLHYQFEAIHPFRDGNGRVGRLLIPLLMCAWRHLPPDRPLLYLSRFFRRHQQEYADRLLAVAREGAWVEFFLQAVIEEASNAWAKAREMRELREKQRMQVANRPGRLSVVVDHLFSNPVITSKDVERVAEVSRETASKYIEILLNEGILSVAGERRWRRPYIAEGILRVLYDESTESFDSRTDGEAQSD